MPSRSPLVRKRAHARRLFGLYNKRYFAGQLPKIPLYVVPGKLKCGSWGETEFEGDQPICIRIAEDNWAVDAADSFLRATVLHEMMHLKLGPSPDHSSPEWLQEALRLSRLGAFVETV